MGQFNGYNQKKWNLPFWNDCFDDADAELESFKNNNKKLSKKKKNKTNVILWKYFHGTYQDFRLFNDLRLVFVRILAHIVAELTLCILKHRWNYDTQMLTSDERKLCVSARSLNAPSSLALE